MKKKLNCHLFSNPRKWIKAYWLMRNFIILFFVFNLSAFSNGLTQQVASVKYEDASLLDVFENLKEQTGYGILYKQNEVDFDVRVNMTKQNVSVQEVLSEALEGTNLTYKVQNEVIVVYKEVKKLHENVAPPVQEKKKITGTVTDDVGVRLPGVSVVAKGTVIGAATDIDGNFKLEIPKETEIIVVSFIGMITKEVELGDKNNFKIILQAELENLDEVVIIGFGAQKKESVVVAMSSIKPKNLSIPTRSLSTALAGQVSGLIAVQRSGEPGYDNAEFWIRGISTFAGGTQPLILVDGVPRNMNDIEPDEIETFSVLKDAAATAVYGAQGANGVVLITTKRGKVSKAKISFRTEHTISQPTRLPEFVGSTDYLSLFNEALNNDGESPLFSEELIAKYRNNEDPDLYPNSNWLDLMLKDYTFNHRYTLNARGGSEKARYFVSGAYFKESGLFSQNPTDKYNTSIGIQRYNLRSNIDMDVSPTTLLSVDLAGQYMENNYPGTGTSGIFRSMLITPPHVFPAYYSDGTVSTFPQERDKNMRNPWNLLMQSGYAKEWRTAFQSKVGVKQKLNFITKGLSLRGNISFDFNSTFTSRRTFNPTRFNATGRNEDGSLNFNQVVSGTPDLSNPSEGSNSSKKIYIESSLNYARTFNSHKIGAMLLYNQRETQYSSESIATRKQGVVGRMTYGFDNRYFIEANFGYSGSETFAKGNRFGFFPAVGLAYYLSNESFYPEGLKAVVDKVKLRVSMGKTGNDNTGGERFLYRSTFTTNGSGFNQGIGSNGGLNGLGKGIYEGRISAPNLTWETEIKKNIGIELGLFSNLIQLTVDYFESERSNILLKRRTIPQVSGFRQDPWQNYGIVENKGIDAAMEANKKIGDFTIGLRSTFTFARNKIKEYDELPQKHPWMAVTGTRVSENTLYIKDRFYTEEDFTVINNTNGTASYILKDHLAASTLGGLLGPGDIKYKDVNGDGVIDIYDKVRGVGNPSVPEIVYGFGLSVKYKGFYANTFFQGIANTSVLLGGSVPEGWHPFAWGVDQSNFRTLALDRWTKANPRQDALMPRLHTNGNNNRNNTQASTHWLRNGSFLRLKNVELGYNFSKKRLRKFGLESARLYVMGYNLHVWDHIKFWDPESGNKNGGLNYPLPRTLTLGLDITF